MVKPSSRAITVNGIQVLVQRKKIKNIHLAVYPPDGRVRISIPLHVNDADMRLMVISKLDWIRKKQTQIQTQPHQSQRQLVSGERISFFGKLYRLEVIDKNGRHKVQLNYNHCVQLTIKPGASQANLQLALDAWYRAELKKHIPALIKKWQPVIGVQVAEWRIKKMKTRWGSCNIRARRIWLNLELAKHSPDCLEYIVVHEMTHLLERYHNRTFYAYMDKFLPNWRAQRNQLKRASLS